MGWLRRFVRPSRQASNWTEWSAPAILFLRLPPDPTSATAIRAQTPIGIAGHVASQERSHVRPCHYPPGDHLTERPTDTPGAAGRSPIDVEDLHRLVLQSLDDDQAQEVVSIPLAGKSNIADHMVIASGRSTRQVASMAVKLGDRIKQQFGRRVADRRASGGGLGADRCRRRDRSLISSRSEKFLQFGTNVGVR